MKRIRVLVVDDSSVIRSLISRALSSDAGIEVVGGAGNGRLALARIESLQPDVVTLDIEMPVLDGIATLGLLRQRWPRLPVIMFSTLTERGALATLDALGAGASDYVTKPTASDLDQGLEQIRSQLVAKIHALGGWYAGAEARTPDLARTQFVWPGPLPARNASPEPIAVVAIGCSTGGPQALECVLPALAGELPVPIVVVQHMPPVFTGLLAQRLDQKCRLAVREARAGTKLEPGTVHLAPGDWHLCVRRRASELYLDTHQEPPENSCRPSVDVLFRSLAESCGGKVLAVVLTGMGQDGLQGSRALVQRGARVIAQDEASSVVWGMPGAVARAALADAVLPLGRIAAEIARRVGVPSNPSADRRA